MRYTALGASDANGVGGSVPCVPFTACENGTGYVPNLARLLRTSRDVTLVNLGIPAAVLSPSIYDIGRRYGRDIPANFIDRELPFVPSESTLITVLGGPNDVNALGDAATQGAGGSDVKGYLDTQIRAFGSDYDRLVQGLRSRAPNAFIILINVPNMAALPYSAGYALPRRQGLQYTATGFTREINRQAGIASSSPTRCAIHRSTRRLDSRRTGSIPMTPDTPIWPNGCLPSSTTGRRRRRHPAAR